MKTVFKKLDLSIKILLSIFGIGILVLNLVLFIQAQIVSYDIPPKVSSKSGEFDPDKYLKEKDGDWVSDPASKAWGDSDYIYHPGKILLISLLGLAPAALYFSISRWIQWLAKPQRES